MKKHRSESFLAQLAFRISGGTMQINVVDRRRLFNTDLITHVGAPATIATPEQQLRRAVLSCLLWEDTFYESGVDIAQRITDLTAKVSPAFVAELAIEARSKFHLRHVPLLLLKTLISRQFIAPIPIQNVIASVIQRPDEMAELLAIYGKDVKHLRPLDWQLKQGLRQAFVKFNGYELSKWQGRRKGITLRDILWLVHPKPKDEEQNAIFRAIAKDELRSEDTWESLLSAGHDKQATWEQLLSERRLGGLALLRNLRNMEQANVPIGLIRKALAEHPFHRVLPFRFIAAARHAPNLEPELDAAFLRVLGKVEQKLQGKTLILVDVSGSMDSKLSNKSDMMKLDAACGVAMILREVCEDGGVASFSDKLVTVPPRHGFALRDAIVHSQSHSSTYLGEAVQFVQDNVPYNRLVVVTDEQSHDQVTFSKPTYLINVAPYRNGVSYQSNVIHIDGFSEAVVRFILEYEHECRVNHAETAQTNSN